jgi:hypothetical protein
MKSGDGGVLDTSRMFHEACAALNQPARKPTRGSGFGARVLVGAGAVADEEYPDDDDDCELEQPATAKAATTKHDTNRDFTESSV